jgi:hypothetical protein
VAAPPLRQGCPPFVLAIVGVSASIVAAAGAVPPDGVFYSRSKHIVFLVSPSNTLYKAGKSSEKIYLSDSCFPSTQIQIPTFAGR